MTELREELAEELVARARIEGELAATGALVVELRGRAERAETDAAHLRAELAEARKPALVRLIEALRRRP